MIEVEPATFIKANINKEIVDKLNPLFIRAGNSAISKIQTAVFNALTSAPEYQALLPGGSLYNQIGNPDIESDLLTIINEILKHITIDSVFRAITANRNYLVGHYSINIVRADFKDILAMPEATFMTEKGSLLKWLEWILLEGNNDIIIGFTYIDIFSPRSRTGKGLMVHSNNENWSVPEYQGTINSNWITIAMNTIEPILLQSIEDTFRNILNS